MSLALVAAVMMDDMPAYEGCNYTPANRVLAFSSWGMLGFLGGDFTGSSMSFFFYQMM